MLTLKQAARQVGMSRSSMHRAVQSGKVSATRAESGMILIEESELARAFPTPPAQLSQVGPSQGSPLGSDEKGDEKAEKGELAIRDAQVAALQAKVQALEELIQRLDRAHLTSGETEMPGRAKLRDWP